MYHCKYYDNRLHIIEKATPTWIEKATHWKGYDNGWHITEKATLTWTEKTTLTYHWKGYDDESHITEKATWNSDVLQHVYIKTCPPEMYLHTSLRCYCFASLPHYPFQHVATCSPHGIGVSAVVNTEQRWPSLSCRPRMEGGVGCVHSLIQMALYASISQFLNVIFLIIILILT
jgi:hypothetical protein